MNEKYETILDAVVRAFLQTHEPIGSEALQKRLPFAISPATIRYYFGKMVVRGELAKLHKSSGRIPTEETMRRFWRKHLREIELISDLFEELARISREEDFYLLLRPVRVQPLLRVERVGSRYLILVFTEEEYVVRYHPQAEHFLKDLVGYSLDEVRQIARDVGLIRLYVKMRARRDEEMITLNEEAILRIAGAQSDWGKRYVRGFLEGDALEEIGAGVHFDPLLPRGFMALKTEALIGDRPMQMLCIGGIDHDFTKLFRVDNF